MKIRHFITLSILFQVFQLSSQINLKVGYLGGYSKLSVTDAIFARANANSPNRSQSLANIRYMHGLDFGARYRFGSFAIDAGMHAIRGDKDGKGLVFPNQEEGDVKMKISSTHFYLGLETHIGHVGFGANIGIHKIKYSADLPGVADTKQILSDRPLASKFYAIFEFPSDNIAFSLRPYVMLPWRSTNVIEVERILNPDTQIPTPVFDQRSMMIGISLCFYNGPQ